MSLDQLIDLLRKLKPSELIGKEAHNLVIPKKRVELYMNCQPNNKTRKSAVLILFYEKNKHVYFCLIKRPHYNGHHSDQVAFPGGKFEKKDGGLTTTAIRETSEEIGVPRENIQIINELSSLYIPTSNFIVKPFIGYYTGTPNFLPNSREVAYVVEAKVTDFINMQLSNEVVSTDKIIAPSFLIENETVWGATAMILMELKEILRYKLA